MSDAHAFFQFVANEALGCLESRDRVLLGLIDVSYRAVYRHINPRRSSSRIQYNFCHVAEIDARIGELALDHGSDFFPQGFSHPVLMMFSCSVLRHGALPAQVNHSGYQRRSFRVTTATSRV